VGFDDFQIASRLWPTLTTVHTPTREIGRLAVERLMGREDAARDPAERLPVLVVRESTAAPAR
jgi:LacI family transcriptional regulator